MATERNAGSQAGADLNAPGYRAGAERDSAGIDAGTTRSMATGQGTTPPMGDMSRGAAEVHSDLRVERDTEYGAIAASSTAESRSMQEEAKNRARQAQDQVREQAQNLGEKAQQAASQAQEKMGQAMHRAESLLEEQGILDRVRQNPLPALGIALGVGFLLAGSGDDEKERGGRERSGGHRRSGGGTMSTLKHQLKGAVMGGLSAALAQEGRNLMGMAQGKGNQGGMLGSLFENVMGGGRSGGSSGGRTGSTGTTAHRPPSHQESF